MSKISLREQLFSDQFATLIPCLRSDLNSVEPATNNALRTAGSSTRSMGGSMLLGSVRLPVQFDSELERRCVLQFLADDDIVGIQLQAVRTPHRLIDGKTSTIWDVFVTLANGLRKLVSVKDFKVAASDRYKALWREICAGIPPGTADVAQIYTQHHIDPVKVDTGNLFNIALTHDRPEAAELAYDFIIDENREMTIGQICAHLRRLRPVPMADHFLALSTEFWAVVWLLAKRAVHLCAHDYIGMSTLVMP